MTAVRTLLYTLLVLQGCLLISACGQTGPLVLPEDVPPPPPRSADTPSATQAK